MLTSSMLSILGRIGHLLSCAIQTFKLSQLGVNHTRPDRSLAFMRHPNFINGLLQRLIENALNEPLLLIPIPGSHLSTI